MLRKSGVLYSGFGDQQIDLSCVSDLSLPLHNMYCVFHDRHGDSQRRNLSVSVCAVSGDSKRGNSKWQMAATAHWWARDDRQSLTQALRTWLLTSCCRPRGNGGPPWNLRTSVDCNGKDTCTRDSIRQLKQTNFILGINEGERKRRAYHFSPWRRGNGK